jgi:hypothetical protein
MVLCLWLWPATKSTATKNTCQTLAILMAMQIRRCDAGCIARWSASVASCKATRCCHWASASAVLPRRMPWSTILNETKNNNKTQFLPSFLTVGQCKKAKNIGTQNGPFTHVIDATNPNPNPNTTICAEGLGYILSYQT